MTTLSGEQWPVADHTRIAIDNNPLEQRMEGWTAHGGLYFDVPYMSEITDGLWQGGCITGLILPTNIKHLISLYPWERYHVTHELTTELYIRAYDSIDQGFSQLNEVAGYAYALWQSDDGDVLVHCQAGLNRSSFVTAKMLRWAGDTDPIATLRSNRSPAALCNPAFEEHIRSGQ